MANGNSAVESLAKILRDLGEKHMHRYRNLLLIFFQAKLLSCRQELNCTQEAMAQNLHIELRSYTSLERGICSCSASTLLFFLLLLPTADAQAFLHDFRTLVEQSRT